MNEKILELLGKAFPEVTFEQSTFQGDFAITFDKQFIVPVCDFLKHDPVLQFTMLNDVTAIDWAKRGDRFTVVYHLLSMQNNFRLRLRCPVNEESCNIDTVTPVWRSANWYERETFDMYGIHFNDHPDLRRMYMPEDFPNHPLRKDYPLMGIPGDLSLPRK